MNLSVTTRSGPATRIAGGGKLSTNSGYNNHTLVEGVHDGKIKSLYIMGEEMAIMDADAHYVQSAFDKLEFVVVQDIFFSRTCEHADVILPAAPSLGKEGTFINTERRLQRLYQVLEPLGNSKPDWLIQTEIARALGAGWDYPSPREIMEEAASLAPMFAGVTYERLEGYKSLQWPIAADGTDTPHLYLDGFAFPDGKAKLYPLEFTPPSEQTDEEFDLHVNNGRLLETFHEGNLTHRSAALRSQVPMNFVEVSPQLARERGIESGSLVKLISRHGEIQIRVLVTDRVEGKELYVPENATDNIRAINLLTSNKADKDSDTPAYKEIAAKMEVLEVDGESPLPRENFRFWKPTPIEGVRTELKWQRPDYVQPPKPAPHPEKF